MSNWNTLFKRGEFRWTEPDRQVAALVPLLKERHARRVLDLACGAGRHLIYLAREGFEMYGTDIAENGLESARQWLAHEQLTAHMAQSEMREIPYADEFFDAVICVRAIQHQMLADLERTTRAIHRVLRPRGSFFATFPTRRDRRYGQGQEVEPNTFLSEIGPDVGVPHHYSNLAEIENLHEGFVIEKIELEEHTDERGNRYSHWLVLAERE